MRVKIQPIAICLALVFSLIMSGPAFSRMNCAGHMSSLKMASASQNIDQTNSHTTPHSHMAGHRASPIKLGQSSKNHHEMQMAECCLSADCQTPPMVKASIRVDVYQPVILVSQSIAVQILENNPLPAPELFERYQMQQGPPLLASSVYKAFLARTTRQIS